ncbi:hypothetical protein ACH474_05395 [Nocardia rhamnosiphila]|uniref:hypothetical protein n=1 Tax=Nocardia rhamnosiphila TaxID=426716 RepID=UPI0037A5741B
MTFQDGPRRRSAAHRPQRDEQVGAQVRGGQLAGNLVVPEGALGLVVFAHGSGSSRHSPRNRFVHLFAEPGALERVAELARDWFVARLASVPAHRGDPDAHGDADR